MSKRFVILSGHILINHDGEGNLNWHRLPDGNFEKSQKEMREGHYMLL